MKKILVVLSLFLLLISPQLAVCATYYVCPANGPVSGDDTRTNVQAQSASTPWANHPDSNAATSNSAAQVLSPGDSIVMCRGGVWWNTSFTTGEAGTSGSLIETTTTDTFGSGAKPIINGAILLNGVWTATGTGTEYKISLATQPYIVFNGDTKLTSGTPGSLPSNSFGWSLNELYVNIGSDPSGGNIQAAQYAQTINITKNYRKYSNLDIRYSNATSPGVVYSVSTTGLQIDSCDIDRGLKYGLRVYSGTYFIISRCVLNNTGSKIDSGISLSDASSNGTVYLNTISNYSTALRILDLMDCYSNTISNSTLGLYILGSNNNVYDNTFSGNWDGVAYPSGTGNDIIIGSGANNTVTRNTMSGGYTSVILKDQSGVGNNLFSFNVVKNYHVNGLYFSTGNTTLPSRVINNVFIHHPAAGYPVGSVGHAISITSAEIHSLEFKHGVVRNNIIVGETSNAEMLLIDSGLDIYTSGQMSGLDIDYNLYWQRNSNASWRFSDPNPADLILFSDWKSLLLANNVTGADIHSKVILSSEPSPFVNADSGDYRITVNSVAINSGAKAGNENMSGLKTDGMGITRYFAPYDRMNMGIDQSYSDADSRHKDVGVIVSGAEE